VKPSPVASVIFCAFLAGCGIDVVGTKAVSESGTDPNEGPNGGGSATGSAPGSSASTPGTSPPSGGPVSTTDGGAPTCADPALAFDGTNDYATAPQSDDLDLDEDFTVEAWIKPSASAVGSGEMHLVSHHDPNEGGWELRLKDGRVEAVVWGSENFSSKGYVAGSSGGAYVAADSWAFVAATLKGDTLRVYYDGALKGSIDLGLLFSRGNYSGPLTFGRAAYVEDYHYAGALDDVRLSKVARYKDATMTKPNAPLTKDDDTVALYTFDEANGAAIADSSGEGHGGTLAAAPETPLRISAPCISDR
jgi:hypothetical protein